VTWRIRRNGSPLESKEKSLIAENLEHFNNFRYWLLAYVIMDDHVHVLVRLTPEANLQKTVHGWKSYTASSLQRISEREGSVWQQEYYDRIVRDEQELRRTLEYIRTNPVKRWPLVAEYQWAKLF